MNKGNTICNGTIPNFWHKSQPNGDRKENCAAMRKEFNDFYDIPCDFKKCGACEIDSSPVYIIRGLCKDSKFDQHYGWTGEFSVGDKYKFQGFSKSYLYWDEGNSYWKLEDNKDPSIYAICNTTKGTYPFGTNKWHFFNDTPCITEENKVLDNVYVQDISFSSCTKSMFNCNDGTW